MTTPMRAAGTLLVGETVNGQKIVAVQIDQDVTVSFEDGTQASYAVEYLVAYQ